MQSYVFYPKISPPIPFSLFTIPYDNKKGQEYRYLTLQQNDTGESYRFSPASPVKDGDILFPIGSLWLSCQRLDGIYFFL